MRLVLSSVTVPVGLVHGAAQVTVNVAAPAIGAMASLNAAVISALLMGMPVALFAGATAVTVGGRIAVESKPRISPLPPPPPQATSAPVKKTASHGRMLLRNLFMGVLLNVCAREKSRKAELQHARCPAQTPCGSEHSGQVEVPAYSRAVVLAAGRYAATPFLDLGGFAYLLARVGYCGR